jgi:hypothetical protein
MSSHDREGRESLQVHEDVVEQLLARAAEIDAQASFVSVAQLRRAATEAGISPTAFDRAVEEITRDTDGSAPSSASVTAASVRRRPWHRSWLVGRRWRVALITGLVAFAVGALLNAPLVDLLDLHEPGEVRVWVSTTRP